MHRDQKLVGQFDGHALTHGAHVVDVLAHGSEHWYSLFEVCRLATHHYGQRAVDGASHATADRRVQVTDATLRGGLSDAPCQMRPDGAGLH